MEKERSPQKKRKIKADISTKIKKNKSHVIDEPSNKRIEELTEEKCKTVRSLPKRKCNATESLPKQKSLEPLSTKECNAIESLSKKKHNTLDLLSEESSKTFKPLLYRENHIEWLKNFLLEHLDTGDPAAVYISGPPGTGKTATVEYVLHLQEISSTYKIVKLNCIELENPASIFKNICDKLNLKTPNSTQSVCCRAIERHLSTKSQAIVLVLDEIDALTSKRKNLLHLLFSLASKTGLLIVGISNAPALMTELKPRLQSRTKMEIHELQFAPYEKDQIIDVITKELADDENVVWEPYAVKMLAAKATLKFGDMRRALHMVRHLSRLARQPNGSGTVRINDVTSGYDNLTKSAIARMVPDDDLPLHQKLLLCSYLVILARDKKKDVTFGVLHDVYTKVAKSRRVTPLGCEEGWNICELLECRGAVSTVKVKNSPLRRWLVHLRWDQEDLEAVMKDKPLLSSILAEGRSFF